MPRNPAASPSPPDPPTPLRPAGRSDGSSKASSKADSAPAGGFFDDAGGPPFDPSQPPPELPAEVLEEGPPASWQERQIRQLLTAQGVVVHGLIAVDKASKEWIHTDADLAAIAPPLTSILNRYPATRAAAAAGDELALIIGLTGYVGRSYGQRRAAIARQQADVEIYAAPEGSGPPEPGPDEAVAVDPLAAEIPPIRKRGR